MDGLDVGIVVFSVFGLGEDMAEEKMRCLGMERSVRNNRRFEVHRKDRRGD
jgi:hypothetical protein